MALSLSKGPHCLQSWLYFVICIIAIAAAGLPLPVPIQVRNPRPAASNSQKNNPEVCIRVLILPGNHDFAGSIRAGF